MFAKADTYFAARFSDVHVEFVAKSTSDAVEIIIFEVVQLKWLFIWHRPLGPLTFVLDLINGQVLQRYRAHLKVPGCKSEGNELLTSEFHKFVSRLN